MIFKKQNNKNERMNTQIEEKKNKTKQKKEWILLGYGEEKHIEKREEWSIGEV